MSRAGKPGAEGRSGKPATEDFAAKPAAEGRSGKPATEDSAGKPAAATEDRSGKPATEDSAGKPATEDRSGKPATGDSAGKPAAEGRSGKLATEDFAGKPAADGCSGKWAAGASTEEKICQKFPKGARLLESRDFTAVLRRGRRKGNALYLLQVWLRPGMESRLGLTVSRKVGKAVVRNRIKRVAREYFRQRRSLLQQGCECVLVARPMAGEVDNSALFSGLDELFTPWFVRDHGNRK